MIKVLRPEELEEKICVVVGTRPGIIKMSPIIRELERRGEDYFIIHTGQHYSYEMDRKFFEDLNLPEPKYKLDTVKYYQTHGAQTGEMLKGVEAALLKEKPKLTLVGGDANTNLAGALAARKLHIMVGHVEAGLRSGDWRMPEEHNRVIIDHISELLFAPTEKERENLIRDNVRGKIFVVGNTIVDAVYQNLGIAERKSDILERLGLSGEDYLVLTVHREENVDFRENLEVIFEAVKEIAEDHLIVFPAHPRTRRRLREFGMYEWVERIRNLIITEPLGYLDFLKLLSNSKLALTDSGGIQEECCILKIPCVTLRENTERPETVEVGANYVAGLRKESILKAVEVMIDKERNWRNPFGDGKTGKRIVEISVREMKEWRSF